MNFNNEDKSQPINKSVSRVVRAFIMKVCNSSVDLDPKQAQGLSLSHIMGEGCLDFKADR